MLRDYRTWLDGERARLARIDDPQAAAQARMAERALERFDAEAGTGLYVPFDEAGARRVLTAIEVFAQQSTAEPPAFAELRDALTAALDETAVDREPLDPRTSG
jgi:hypothetical protein